MTHALALDTLRQLETDDVERLLREGRVPRAHPPDLRIVVVEVEPRPSRRLKTRAADVDHAVVREPRVDPRLGLELSLADGQPEH